MDELILLKRPGMRVGDRREHDVAFAADPFDLYGRRHEVEDGRARVVATRLSEGLHVEISAHATVRTTCDRTLEPVGLPVEFGDSEFLSGPNDRELSVRDWELDVRRYAERALPSEVPMRACAPGTEPVGPPDRGDEMDPRWRALDGLFATG